MENQQQGRNLEFMECDTCRAKPGSPALCGGCLHNRDVISWYERPQWEKDVVNGAPWTQDRKTMLYHIQELKREWEKSVRMQYQTSENKYLIYQPTTPIYQKLEN